MLSFEGFVHRTALAELVSRWMVNHPRFGDVHELKKIVNFNLYVTRFWIDFLARELLTGLHGTAPGYHHIKTKGELKDRIVENPAYSNPRIEELIARYRRFPEDFYRETPFDGGYYTVAGPKGERIVACTRIKRLRRIAEKGSRRIVNYLFRRIQANATALADGRAMALGIPQSQLLTPPEIMAEEFLHAERRVLKSIKLGSIEEHLPVISIPDVVGIKIIDEDPEFERLRSILEGNGACRIIDEDRHTGDYKATNIRVSCRLPRDVLRNKPPSGRFLKLLRFRGLDPERIPRMYDAFLESAEDTVTVEIIVSTFEQCLESEIGRCMHEEHIQKQRSNPVYIGHLATNVQYLMDYMLALCRSPACKELTEVPVKLWIKYMPDTVNQLARRLYLSDDLFFDTIS